MNDGIIKDIGRKCADDVSDAIKRNMQLIPDQRGKFLVAVYAAVTGIASASGAFAATTGMGTEPNERMIDELWAEFFRPLAIGQLPSFVEDEARAALSPKVQEGE